MTGTRHWRRPRLQRKRHPEYGTFPIAFVQGFGVARLDIGAILRRHKRRRETPHRRKRVREEVLNLAQRYPWPRHVHLSVQVTEGYRVSITVSRAMDTWGFGP